MDVSGQVHAPAALLPGKKTRYSEPVWTRFIPGIVSEAETGYLLASLRDQKKKYMAYCVVTDIPMQLC
jgi:hypothetical protein